MATPSCGQKQKLKKSDWWVKINFLPLTEILTKECKKFILLLICCVTKDFMTAKILLSELIGGKLFSFREMLIKYFIQKGVVKLRKQSYEQGHSLKEISILETFIRTIVRHNVSVLFAGILFMEMIMKFYNW